jgi:hypothetical protein
LRTVLFRAVTHWVVVVPYERFWTAWSKIERILDPWRWDR